MSEVTHLYLQLPGVWHNHDGNQLDEASFCLLLLVLSFHDFAVAWSKAQEYYVRIARTGQGGCCIWGFSVRRLNSRPRKSKVVVKAEIMPGTAYLARRDGCYKWTQQFTSSKHICLCSCERLGIVY